MKNKYRNHLNRKWQMQGNSHAPHTTKKYIIQHKFRRLLFCMKPNFHIQSLRTCDMHIMFLLLWIIYNELFNYDLTNITYIFCWSTRYMKKYSCTFEANMNFHPTSQIIYRIPNHQVQHETKPLMVLFIHYSFF